MPFNTRANAVQTSVVNALDTAISETVEGEHCRLTRNMAERQKSDLFNEARRQVLSLRNLEMPEYDDEFVAMVYVAAYQLQHIHLTYSMVKDMQSRRNASTPAMVRTGNLQVVDFGCGALAMQFGVALAVADALEAGENITHVKVDSMDINRPMLFIGRKIWKKFVDIVERDKGGDLRWVRKACRRLQFRLHTRVGTIERVGDADSWLSAIHAVYEENEATVKRDLKSLYDGIAPVAGFMTCYAKHDQQDNQQYAAIAKRVSPFVGPKYDLRQRTGKELRRILFGEAERTTEINRNWRLINDPTNDTRRTHKAVLDWTWDIALFEYASE